MTSLPVDDSANPDDALPSIYDVQDVVGQRVGLPGGGLHAYLTGDMLHPPMVDDAAVWGDGRRWAAGSTRHAEEVIALTGVRFGDAVLDIGCGLGGPARLMVDGFGTSVVSLTKSTQHADTARKLNAARPQWARNISVQEGDITDYSFNASFDAAVSINMLYLLEDKPAAFSNIFYALRSGGCFVVDDWMTTSRITADDLDELNFHFNSRSFADIERVESDLMLAGFPPAEYMEDRGAVGRGVMAAHFESEMRRFFEPLVIADWPGDYSSRPGQGAWGAQMVQEWIDGVNVTLRLYRERKLTYRRLRIRKPA